MGMVRGVGFRTLLQNVAIALGMYGTHRSQSLL